MGLDILFNANQWIVDKLRAGIWGWLYDFAESLVNDAFKSITEFIIIDTRLDHYIDLGYFLNYLQLIAASLLIVSVLWEVFKQISGVLPTESKSIGAMIQQTIFSTVLIFMLPWSVTHIFIPLNNYLVRGISEYGTQLNPGNNTIISAITAPSEITETIILLMIVLGIAGIVLGVIAGIRYVELIIVVLFSPIVAISVPRGGDGLSVWVRETVAITFTQSLHVFLLKLLIGVFGVFGSGLLDYSIAIGILVVMISGPKVIRQFVYSVGVGSAAVGGVGSAGRMAAMKHIMKSAKPT